ncbi:MAG: tRNA lysidine(34) synthetase TilS [Croceitalea sp.]|nr:tRNA lysidine(34) synthetase TilS [Croceitalea sp.]
MWSKFQAHINKNFPFLLKANLLVACSGGLDSVVLAHLCQKLKVNFALAHCNYRLRATESDEDQVFVKNLAEKYKCSFHEISFDTKAEVKKSGGSTQMVARELRYTWFEQLAKDHQYEYVLTAHHADDNLETFIINLSRGTGIDGLKGIPEVNEHILRPLLPFTRQELLKFAGKEKLKWREDSSNQETKYLRNNIRHHIVPELKKLHSSFDKNFQMTLGHLKESSLLLDAYARILKAKLFKKEGAVIKIKVAQLWELEPLRGHLHLLFNDYRFTAWDDIENLLTSISGKAVQSKTHLLLKDRDQLLLTEIIEEKKERFYIAQGQDMLLKPLKLQLTTVDALDEVSEQLIYVDNEKLNYPLLVRKWEKGDYFYPFGMKGSKKLSKYFKDEKLDMIAKKEQWLLCSDNQIVWVIGRRADNRFRVTTATKKIVRIKLLK